MPAKAGDGTLEKIHQALYARCREKEGRQTFQNTVKLLWPEAGSGDMKKLEKFLFLLKKTAH